MRAKKVVITFVAIVFFVKFSWDIYIAFIPSKFGIMCKVILHQVLRDKISMGFSLRRKSLVSLI